MSIKIAKLKNYIKETYEKLGEINYSNYWNLGYINALMDKGIISKIEAGNLINHNDKIYLVEDMKIIKRKISSQMKKLERRKPMIKLGDKVKDTITGFEGIAIAKCIYLNGCVSYQVRTKGLKDGRIIEGEWIDEQQLTEKSKAEAGGPGDVPSEFSHP